MVIIITGAERIFKFFLLNKACEMYRALPEGNLLYLIAEFNCLDKNCN